MGWGEIQYNQDTQHLLSYKKTVLEVQYSLESQALTIRELQFTKAVPKGLLEAYLRTKGFSQAQKPQPGCQVSNLPPKLEVLEFFSEEELKEF